MTMTSQDRDKRVLAALSLTDWRTTRDVALSTHWSTNTLRLRLDHLKRLGAVERTKHPITHRVHWKLAGEPARIPWQIYSIRRHEGGLADNFGGWIVARGVRRDGLPHEVNHAQSVPFFCDREAAVHKAKRLNDLETP